MKAGRVVGGWRDAGRRDSIVIMGFVENALPKLLKGL